jgi:aromatic ring-opening dioxygenase catalytic subunit (LigB family)
VLDREVGRDQAECTPMILIRPQADIPVGAISVPGGGEDTEAALRMGKALKKFRDEGLR